MAITEWPDFGGQDRAVELGPFLEACAVHPLIEKTAGGQVKISVRKRTGKIEIGLSNKALQEYLR